MKTPLIFRYPMKKPGIYKSEHEPFLFGNIAKRGVIRKISRKAISPLAKLLNSHKLQMRALFLPLKKHPYFRTQVAEKKSRAENGNTYSGLPIRHWLETHPVNPEPILISGNKIFKRR